MRNFNEEVYKYLWDENLIQDNRVDVSFIKWWIYSTDVMNYWHNLDNWEHDDCFESTISLEVLKKLDKKDIEIKKRYIRIRINYLLRNNLSKEELSTSSTSTKNTSHETMPFGPKIMSHTVDTRQAVQSIQNKQ